MVGAKEGAAKAISTLVGSHVIDGVLCLLNDKDYKDVDGYTLYDIKQLLGTSNNALTIVKFTEVITIKSILADCKAKSQAKSLAPSGLYDIKQLLVTSNNALMIVKLTEVITIKSILATFKADTKALAPAGQ